MKENHVKRRKDDNMPHKNSKSNKPHHDEYIVDPKMDGIN